MKKIILTNLLIFFVLFCILEFVSYLYLKEDSREYVENYNNAARAENRPILTLRYGKIKVADTNSFQDYRQNNIGNKNKPSILFFGCSYMYGTGLQQEETLPYFITKKTGRTTVNRGVPGGCIMNMFRDLNTPSFYENLKKYPEPDYVVYLWINDHINRINNIYMSSVRPTDYPYYLINTKWIEEDGELKEIYPKKWEFPFYAMFCSKAYHFFYAQNFSRESSSEKMFRYFKIANNKLKNKFPKARFVIIEYKDGGHCLMQEELRENLKKEGIMVLNAEEIVGHELETEKWRGSDKEHPNGKAFEDLSDGLIKALHL